jgi:hypothetical protein
MKVSHNSSGFFSGFAFILNVGIMVTLMSCVQKEVRLPAEKEKLVQLLEDIYLAEGMADGADLAVRDSVRGVYMLQIAKHHGMSIEEMEDIFKELSQMPDSLYSLQGMALDSLRIKQVNLKEKANLGQY